MSYIKHHRIFAREKKEKRNNSFKNAIFFAIKDRSPDRSRTPPENCTRRAQSWSLDGNDSLPSYDAAFLFSLETLLESREIDSAYMGSHEWRCSTAALIDGLLDLFECCVQLSNGLAETVFPSLIATQNIQLRTESRSDRSKAVLSRRVSRRFTWGISTSFIWSDWFHTFLLLENYIRAQRGANCSFLRSPRRDIPKMWRLTGRNSWFLVPWNTRVESHRCNKRGELKVVCKICRELQGKGISWNFSNCSCPKWTTIRERIVFEERVQLILDISHCGNCKVRALSKNYFRAQGTRCSWNCSNRNVKIASMWKCFHRQKFSFQSGGL